MMRNKKLVILIEFPEKWSYNSVAEEAMCKLSFFKDYYEGFDVKWSPNLMTVSKKNSARKEKNLLIGNEILYTRSSWKRN